MTRFLRLITVLSLNTLLLACVTTTDSTPPDPGALSYQQLSTEQRDGLRGQYEALPASDEPPYPLLGISAFGRPLGELMFRERATGILLAILSIDPQGKVAAVQIQQKPKGVPEAAIVRILTAVAFKPALCASKPCSMEFLVQQETIKVRRD